MLVFWIILCLAVLLCALYVYALSGRRNHRLLCRLRKWSYAHRGLHNVERPENSMAAFRAALEKGYGIELDVHLLADGELAVIHDSNLKRVAGADVMIEDLTVGQLGSYRLGGTEEPIPLFRQVLELFDGKAPLIVELKSAGGNHKALSETVAKMLDRYDGDYCIESFDPKCVRWFKKHRPNVVRGQLAMNFMKNKRMPWIIRFIMTNNLLNFLTWPDFIAYAFESRGTLSNFICRKLHKLQGVAWTVRSQAAYDTAIEEGWIPIFENIEP